jgi:hypothetical protein
MKNFDLSEFARKLAFNVPVVEKTAPCDNCYRETPVADMQADLCPECAARLHPDEAFCRPCGEWKHWSEMATDTKCESCYQDYIDDIDCHLLMET